MNNKRTPRWGKIQKKKLHYADYFSIKKRTKKHKLQCFSGKTVHMYNQKNMHNNYRMSFYHSEIILEIILFETLFNPID